MARQGRFGKYGEIKRIARLKPADTRSPFHQWGKKIARAWYSPFKASSRRKIPVGIRPAKPSDSDFISRLGGEVFRVYGPYKDIVLEWFQSGTVFTTIALMGEKAVGFGMIGPFRRDRVNSRGTELLAIAVEPEKQGTGIGRMILEATEKTAAAIKIDRIFLHTAVDNRSARKLFTECGYSLVRIKKTFYPEGQDAITMVKEIQRKTE